MIILHHCEPAKPMNLLKKNHAWKGEHSEDHDEIMRHGRAVEKCRAMVGSVA